MASEHHPARWPGGKRSVRAYETDEAPAVELEPAAEQVQQPEPVTGPETQPEPQEPLVTDAARQLAFQHGIDLRDVTGTGAEGRITQEDVAGHIPAQND